MKNVLCRILLCLLLTALALSLAACGDKSEYAPPSGYILASNEDADYCLFVPDEWTVDMNTAAAGAYYSNSDPSSVSVMAWELEHTDTTLDEWWETNKTDINLVFTDLEVISEENTTLDELYAKRYTYTASIGENAYKFMQEAAIKDGSVYVFTYTSLADNYDVHIDDVEEILGFVVIK